jgi:hypothetical protein
MCSTQGIQTSLWMGCPIRNLKAHRSYAAPLERFAGLRVLHRLGVPRHPPRTLSRLWTPPSGCPAGWISQRRVALRVCVYLCCFNSLLSAKLKLSCTIWLFRVQVAGRAYPPTTGMWKATRTHVTQTPSPVCHLLLREGPTWDTFLCARMRQKRDSLERR